MMATIRVTDLLLRTVIGTHEWERNTSQDVIINLALEFDASKAASSDAIKDTVDYKTLTKKIIALVEGSKYHLIERLAAAILDVVMEHPSVEYALVRVDKPQALRFARSVSVEMERHRKALQRKR